MLEGYVYCWRVQYAYERTDMQRDTLVASLADIDGAVKECPAWWKHIEIQPLPPISGILMSFRAKMLYDALVERDKNAKIRHFTVFLPSESSVQQNTNVKKDRIVSKVSLPPKKVLDNVIRQTYQGTMPEKNDISKAFSRGDYEDDDFYGKYFEPLYYDSLLLRAAAIT